MKNIFYILLLLPTIIFAQYPSNSGQKITLGEQTTADGLVYRGVANDTNVITPFSDTSAYIILDTVNSKFYHYNRTTTFWALAGGGGDSGGVTSFSAGTTGLTPSTATTGAVTLGGTLAVANGGTGNNSFASGNIPFSNGTLLTSDTSLYWDNTNKRLGIGTKTPNNPLSVRGRITMFGGNDAFYFSSNGIAEDKWHIGVAGVGTFMSITESGVATRLRILVGGNVGISETTPTARLHVKGSGVTSGTSALKVDNSGGTNLLNILDNGVATFRNISNSGAPSTSGTTVNATLSIDNAFSVMTNIGNLSVSPYSVWLQVQDKGNLAVTYPLSLQPNGGNVGIGTASPSGILEVVGENTTNKLILATYTTGVTGSNVRLRHARGTVASPTTIVNADELGQFIFQGYDGTSFLNGAQIRSGVDAAVSTNVMPGFLSFLTNQGNERMRITSDGNVGIGTASPNKQSFTKALTVNAISSNVGFELSLGDVAGFDIFYNNLLDVYLTNRTNGSMIFRTNSTERMRITSDGNVSIGTTSITTDDGITLYSTGQIYSNVAGTTSNQQVRFYRNNTVVGSITTDGSTTSYITSSDYRLKQDFKDYNGLDLISAIKTYNYEWKSDNTRTYGVLAHELQEVIPQAVFGEKDGKEMQGVDYSKLVPILIKSVQELSAEIDILKQEIINLKNK